MFTRMVNEVNAKAALSNRVGVFAASYTWNQWAVWQRHKIDSPDRRTRNQLVISVIVFVALFLLNAIVLLIFGS